MDSDALSNGPRPEPSVSPPDGPDQGLPAVIIPDHQMLRCIGRGSYGSVWLARNMMGVYRAVKIVVRKSFAHQRPFEREVAGIRRFEPISRSHEGFVDVLHVGINDEQGYFYYVMELGDDQGLGQNIVPESYAPMTLAKQITLHGRLPSQQCLELGLALSRALAELHKHGLVHRDVKPSNIIFVHGIPKLADIGLVTEISEAPSYVGTEGFIPPEGPGTPGADVYGLGKVLYEASTGKDRQDFPELPTQWDKGSDLDKSAELNEIIIKACKGQAARRYQSAWDMHADLVVVANGKSVRRLRLLERRLAKMKRAAGVLALVLVVAAGVSYQIYREWKRAQDSRQQQVGENVAYGNRAMEAGDLMGSLPYFAEALQLDAGNAEGEAQHRTRFGSVLAQCPKLVQMWSVPKEIGSVAFSPDGQRVLVVERDMTGQAQIFDAATARPLSQRFGQPTRLRRGLFSPGGEFVATASEAGAACVWRSDGSRVASLQHPGGVMCLSFNGDGQRLVTGCLDGVARVWAWQGNSTKPVLEIRGHTGALLSVTFSPDGRRIATTSKDRTARLWDAKDGRQVLAPLIHPKWVGGAAFSPDGQTLVTVCDDHKARVWDATSGKRLFPDLDHGDVVSGVEFSRDGQVILTACLDGLARLWLAESRLPLNPNPFLRNSDRVGSAAFSPDGHRVVTGCVDGTVRIWDLAASVQVPVHLFGSFSQDGSRFLTRTNNEMQVWDTLTQHAVSAPIKPAARIEDATLDFDGHSICLICQTEASGVPGRTLEVLDAESGQREGPPVSLSESLKSVALSGDGQCVLAFGGKVARSWNTLTGQAMAAFEHSGDVGGAVFGPAATIVATWNGKVVHVWEAATGHELFPPLEHDVQIAFANFSPDGGRLVTCTADPQYTKCEAQIWNAATGQRIGPPLKHQDGVLWATFSPDQRRVVTTSEDFTAVVWDAMTGRRLTAGLQHGNQVQRAAFSSDSKCVVTASSDHTARVWSTETGMPLSPPLRHAAELVDAKFLADKHWVLTTDKYGESWLWKLPAQDAPVKDLLRLTRLLSGGSVIPSGGLPGLHTEPEPLSAIWHQLRTNYPSVFAASDHDLETRSKADNK